MTARSTALSLLDADGAVRQLRAEFAPSSPDGRAHGGLPLLGMRRWIGFASQVIRIGEPALLR